MAEITARQIESKSLWEDFIAKHPEANFLQSWYWGEFHKALGKTIERVGLYEGENLVGVMLAVVEDARRGRYLTVAGGPIIDWRNSKLVEAFVDELKNTAKKYQCVFARVRPQLVEDDFSKPLFLLHKFKSAPMHLTADLTSQIDLSPTEEELMANIRKNTRYEIRKAQNLGIKITSTQDPTEIVPFYQMQLDTAKRHGFIPFSLKFLQEQFRVFAEQGAATLYTAEHEGVILAQAFIIFYGSEATYHYGASTADGRKYPGAYLIQWEVIREAKKKGLKRYNLWGVAPEGATEHRFWGVSVFKRGFGGKDVQYMHAQDLIVNPMKYTLNYAVEMARKKVRRV